MDIRADGVLLAQRKIHALDTNGDFALDASDFSYSNPLCDYNCDHTQNFSDFALFGNHAGARAFVHGTGGRRPSYLG